MTRPPQGLQLAVPQDGAAVTVEKLTSSSYLELYSAVGGPLQWDQRLKLAAHDLEFLLAGAKLQIHVLRLRGEAVGFCEFEATGQREFELKNFGLVERVHGQRLGPFLLDRALRGIWLGKPRRVFLHTDEWDHQSAQRTYLRAGFTIYDQRRQDATDL